MRNEINAVDLTFVVDTTGSMGGLIAAAQNQMITMLEELTRAANINLWLGVVEYRDHPPQDTMLYKVYPLTEDLQKAQKAIRGLHATGGGDAPEAVLDGVVAACNELAWWKHARRLMVLVGDAPPHGVGMQGDAFRTGCPCGETIESVTRLAEEKRITIHALGLTDAVTTSFSIISSMTGGKFFSLKQADKTIEAIATLLKAEFDDLELDRRLLDAWRDNPEITVDELAERMQRTRHVVSASLVRLLSRDLIEVPAILEG
ncbi:MAG TPA: VWA domain-containing protein [Ktedonobacteraceae bacterium]|nr:VWA domain-containing protein [Ktedonobacteraceae bacterium]